MRNLTLRQIKIFLSATKHMSFTRAAEELHISAPAISMQIKEMEEDMGVTLFLRENKKLPSLQQVSIFWYMPDAFLARSLRRVI